MPVGVFGGGARGRGRERGKERRGGGVEGGKKGEERVDESTISALQVHIKTSCVYISLSC